MTTAEQNYLLLQEIEANRRFLLMAYQQNPELLERAEARIKQIFETIPTRGREVFIGKSKQRGVSLVELIMFIVIISVALTGILGVMNIVMRHSADPLVHKQALAIAESMLEEVELMPFTYCDPDDASAVSATGAFVGVTGCNATIEIIGRETIAGVPETRYGGAAVNAQFDNVNDYNTFSMLPGAILDIAGGGGAPAGYTLSPIVVTPVALFGILATDANGAAQVLQITVTVTGPDLVPITLDGYRTRYAPNNGP
jgi:MSHA pilin protein MshD